MLCLLNWCMSLLIVRSYDVKIYILVDTRISNERYLDR